MGWRLWISFDQENVYVRARVEVRVGTGLGSGLGKG